jgi:hypothetical protein
MEEKTITELIATCSKEKEIEFMTDKIYDLMEKCLISQVERLNKKVSYLPFEMLEYELELLKTKSLKELNEEELNKWIDNFIYHIKHNIHLIEQLRTVPHIQTLTMDDDFVTDMVIFVDLVSLLKKTRIPYRNVDILFRQFVFLLVEGLTNRIKIKLKEIM